MCSQRTRSADIGFSGSSILVLSCAKSAGSALGRQAWYMGYRPSYLFLRALYRARENFASLAMVYGYAAAAISGAPQCPHPPVTLRIREGQRLRVVFRRGGWT